jgi:hypothetical protein
MRKGEKLICLSEARVRGMLYEFCEEIIAAGRNCDETSAKDCFVRAGKMIAATEEKIQVAKSLSATWCIAGFGSEGARNLYWNLKNRLRGIIYGEPADPF